MGEKNAPAVPHEVCANTSIEARTPSISEAAHARITNGERELWESRNVRAIMN